MNQKSIIKGLNAIAKHDNHVKHALLTHGYPQPRTQAAGFDTLVNTIVGQQLSTKAANAIMLRVRQLLPDLTPNAVLRKRKTTLRNTGLSERKVEYIQGLAKAIQAGEFDPELLENMDNESAIVSITNLRGFGEWSAEIYLMFSLKRVDIFPANDLALQVALQNLKQLQSRPTPKIARQLVEKWSPWRSAGSLFLWHYYKNLKNQ